MRLIILFSLCLLLACAKQPENYRSYIDLAGEWQFSLDPADTGIQSKWYATDLSDSIELPGTTDLRKKGYLNFCSA